MNNRILFATVSALSLMAVFNGAYAQETAAEAVEEVIITGSRVIRDGSQAPTPVTVMGVEQLNNDAPRNPQEALTNLPVFAGSQSTNTGQMAVGGSNQTGGFLNLRGLGGNRTLVLLDGRRVAPAGGDGSTNFNLLPQSLISRIDVVTGGASAQYGSDAVAGVVNVITENNFTGLKGSIQGGISDRGDVGSYRATLTAGGDYLDDRLHVIASGLINRTDPVYRSDGARDWVRTSKQRQIVGAGKSTTLPDTGTGTGAVSDLYANVNQRFTVGGVLLPGAANGPANLVNQTALSGIGRQFLPGGISGIYEPGTQITNQNQVGGSGVRQAIGLAALLESNSMFARATFDLTDVTEIYLQAMSSTAHNRYDLSFGQAIANTQITIFEGNPFIPADVAALLAASTPTSDAAGSTLCGQAALTSEQLALYRTGPTDTRINPATSQLYPAPPALRCFKMSRQITEKGRLAGDIQNDIYDLVAGFRTEIFGLRLSGYYEHGQNRTRTLTANNQHLERTYAAADVIANPAVGGVPGVAAGAPVCRMSVVSPTLQPACTPANYFGFGSLSEQALDFIFDDSFHRLKTRQDVAALDLAGNLFELPAGPVDFAVGIEARRLAVQQIGDFQMSRYKDGNGIRGFPAFYRGVIGAYLFTNQQSYGGEVTVKEGYAEVVVPLLKEVFLAEDLSLNAAYRYTEYSNSGGVKSYKVGATYRPVKSFLFRGAYSRDIRAPSPVELFQGNAQGAGLIADPNPPAPFLPGAQFQVVTSTRGNPLLKPETADSYTAGVVFTPTWIEGLSLSVDYWDIAIEDAIGTLGAASVLDLCAQGNQNLCQYVIRAPVTGILQSVINLQLNLNERATSGLDFEANYRTELPFVPGRFNFRVLAGYLDEASTTPLGGNALDSVGQVASLSFPHLKGQGSINWENGPVSLNIQVKYVGHGYQNVTTTSEGGWNPISNSTTNTIVNNRIGSHTTFDIGGRYKFGEDLQYEAFLTVNNFLDRDPQMTTGGSATNIQATNNELYDTIGRYYTTGLRFRF